MAQNTVNLWSMLCGELESSREGRSSGEHVEAARKFERTAREVFRERPERLREALEIAGDVQQSEGEPGEARRCFEEALAIAAGAPEARSRLATKLALLEESAGELDGARRHYQLAVEGMTSGHDRSQRPTLLNNLAALHRQAGDLAAAESCYERALAEAAELHGPDHPEVALFANNLAVTCTDRGNLVKAEHLHLRALQIRERTFGAHHPEVAASLANLAAVYHAQNLPGKAERFYQSALHILTEFHGAGDPEVRRIRESYESLPQVRARGLARTQRLG